MKIFQCGGSGFAWILVGHIRIRIGNADPLLQEGKNDPLLRTEVFCCLEVLKFKLQFLSAVHFFMFLSLNPLS
jgi:hypothetical protein